MVYQLGYYHGIYHDAIYQHSAKFHCANGPFTQPLDLSDITTQSSDFEVKNWNEEFQSLLSKITDDELDDEERLQQYINLSHLAHDFQYVAKTYGKIIILERCLPPEHKTIKPVDIGGMAGGEKYICQGILFKFAVDAHGIYGGDEHSMKAAGHDLKGLMAFYKCQIEGIHVPLMTLIDYRGFRLIAMSILPLDKIIYGSCDGGRTVHADDEVMNNKMQMVAKKLNLKGHWAGIGEHKQFIYGPTDIEGHIGKDGRYYVIDFARVFPPESPTYSANPESPSATSKSSSYLYKLLRPEFVIKNPVPLSSDAFCVFGRDNKEVHNQDIIEATARLHKRMIPKFAAWLEGFDSRKLKTQLRLTEMMHREGLNVRHLGVLRSLVASTQVKQLLLMEMIARVVKCTLRFRLRRKMEEIRRPSEEPYRQEVIGYFNLVFGRPPAGPASAESDRYWKHQLKQDIAAKFESALSTEELSNPSLDLRVAGGVDMVWLFRRTQKITGVKFAKKVEKELENNPATFELVYPDIEKISVRIKHMNIIDHAEGMALYIQSTRAKGEEGNRLFQLAMSKFEAALSSTPDNFLTLKSWGDALHQQALRTSGGEEREKLVALAAEKYAARTDCEALVRLGDSLFLKAQSATETLEERERLYSMAADAYKMATDFDRTLWTGFYRWGNLLFEQAHMKSTGDAAEATIALAGEKYLQALLQCPGVHPALEATHAARHDLVETLTKSDVASLVQLSQHCPSMSTLDASWCRGHLTDAVVAYFARHHAEALRTLRLAGCKKITDGCFVTPAAFPATAVVDLSGCHAVTDDVIANLAAACPKVEVLDLSNCPKVTGAVSATASAAAAFPNLSSLSLCECRRLTNSVLVDLVARCPSLTTLRIAGCLAITNEGIARIADLCRERLRHLDISNCRLIDDEGVTAVAERCPMLQCMKLTGLKLITKTAIAALATRCQGALQVVKLGGCTRLVDAAVLMLANHCPNLTAVDLTKCKSITSAAIEELARSVGGRLRSLVLSDCPQVSDEALVTISQTCTALSTLKLDGLYKITDDGVVHIAKAFGTSLTTLHLGECEKITYAALNAVADHCTRLRSLNVTNLKQITTVSMKRLAQRCRGTLQKIDLTSCKQIKSEAVTSLASHCPNLQGIILSWCVGISTPAICQLVATCGASLRVIELSECKQVTDEVLQNIAQFCGRSLEVLGLTNCHKITDAGAISLAAHGGSALGGIKVLRLSGCHKLTDVAIMKIAQHAPQLQVLKLGKCYKISDSAVMKVARCCPGLQVLHLNGCKQITDTSIMQLAACCATLQRLGVDSCNLITKQAILEIKKLCPQLEIFNKF